MKFRSVSQPACLHDLLWSFVSTLEANSNTEVNNTGTNINDDKNKALAKVKQKFAKIEGLFDHPSEDISIAGEAIQPLPSIFHGLLQTVSDLMLLLPVSNAIVVTLIAMFMQFWLSLSTMFIMSDGPTPSNGGK